MPAPGAILQVMLHGAEPAGYYPKVLKGVLLLDPRSWTLVFGRFILGLFIFGPSFLGVLRRGVGRV